MQNNYKKCCNTVAQQRCNSIWETATQNCCRGVPWVLQGAVADTYKDKYIILLIIFKLCCSVAHFCIERKIHEILYKRTQSNRIKL